MRFYIKQILKMIAQNIILPIVYGFWKIVYFNRDPELIVFADAHHVVLPFSMERMFDEINKRGYVVEKYLYNYDEMSYMDTMLNSIAFMRLYARAKYVFICDNFLPVSSCKKSRKTKVIQLMHSSGLLKKMGYDTSDDVPVGYIGNVYKNYDLVTVSAPCCVEVLTKAMRQPKGIVKALGTSRTDYFMDEEWLKCCKKFFYAQYPEVKDKNIILWAPTFRGNASDADVVGIETIKKLEKALGEKFFVIYKVHPHSEHKYHLSNCSIPTERLLPVVDLLISDYSSVVNDFMFFDRPYVLFAPDFDEFEKKRGFYVEYSSLTPYVIKDESEIYEVVVSALKDKRGEWMKNNRIHHLSCCDGHATDRILNYVGIKRKKNV